MTTSSLPEIAAEIIRLYHSPAPIRENLDLIQRHGLAMAQALVEIDKQVDHAQACGGYMQPISPSVFFDRISTILDGSVAAQEKTT